MVMYNGLSHCKLALVFAVFMDVLGGAALLVGVFADLKMQERDYGDLLVYTGMFVWFNSKFSEYIHSHVEEEILHIPVNSLKRVPHLALWKCFYFRFSKLFPA